MSAAIRTSFVSPQPGRPRVLWVDDHYELIEKYKAILENQEEGFEIDICVVNSLEAARQQLGVGTYCALVVDCKMDEYDVTENGAEFLLSVNEQYKELPTFVYSAFLEDPLYEDRLKQSNVICASSKSGVFQRPLAHDPFFRIRNELCDMLQCAILNQKKSSLEDIGQIQTYMPNMLTRIGGNMVIG
jgi:hypothetical protein